MSYLLTKSKYLLGLQCPKLLWVSLVEKERIPKPDEITQKKFDEGTIISELAMRWYPQGVDLSKEDFDSNLEKTKEFLKKRVPIFEAGFLVDGLYSRADILVPVSEDEWDIVEVKSATKVKDINIHDLSFQKYVYEKAGIKINQCYLMNINNEYIMDNPIEPKELFVQTEITEKVSEFSERIKERIAKMERLLEEGEPECKISVSCNNPYECPIKTECWDEVPENSVFDFYRMLKKKCFELYHEGIICLNDVPENVKLNGKQSIQKRLACDGGKHIDKTEIKNFLGNLKYPIYYLDFETINPALPKFNGMKPYQRIPFQFSLHIQKEKGGEVEHISFLAEGTEDPRQKFMQSLKDNLGEEGSILVYNQSFEKGVMNESATAFPEFMPWYEKNILPRIKDLWDVFRNFWYYDSKQKGSASIKAVLPVMSELSYRDLKDVKKGDQASYEYERVTYDPLVSEEERQKIREALEKYCELDTLAEVEIVRALGNIVCN